MMIDVWRDDGFGALFTNIHMMFRIWVHIKALCMYGDVNIPHSHM